MNFSQNVEALNTNVIATAQELSEAKKQLADKQTREVTSFRFVEDMKRLKLKVLDTQVQYAEQNLELVALRAEEALQMLPEAIEALESVEAHIAEKLAEAGLTVQQLKLMTNPNGTDSQFEIMFRNSYILKSSLVTEALAKVEELKPIKQDGPKQIRLATSQVEKAKAEKADFLAAQIAGI